jgi:hypothetical protein
VSKGGKAWVLDPKNIYLCAEANREACLRLLAQSRQGLRLVPSGILSSFAFELFLKCLFAIENPEEELPREHSPKVLFGLLSLDTQNEIRKQSKLGDEFDTLLSDGADAFTTLRYFYEGNFRSWGLGPISDATREVIKKRRPGWEYDRARAFD